MGKKGEFLGGGTVGFDFRYEICVRGERFAEKSHAHVQVASGEERLDERARRLIHSEVRPSGVELTFFQLWTAALSIERSTLYCERKNWPFLFPCPIRPSTSDRNYRNLSLSSLFISVCRSR